MKGIFLGMMFVMFTLSLGWAEEIKTSTGTQNVEYVPKVIIEAPWGSKISTSEIRTEGGIIKNIKKEAINPEELGYAEARPGMPIVPWAFTITDKFIYILDSLSVAVKKYTKEGKLIKVVPLETIDEITIDGKKINRYEREFQGKKYKRKPSKQEIVPGLYLGGGESEAIFVDKFENIYIRPGAFGQIPVNAIAKYNKVGKFLEVIIDKQQIKEKISPANNSNTFLAQKFNLPNPQIFFGEKIKRDIVKGNGLITSEDEIYESFFMPDKFYLIKWELKK